MATVSKRNGKLRRIDFDRDAQPISDAKNIMGLAAFGVGASTPLVIGSAFVFPPLIPIMTGSAFVMGMTHWGITLRNKWIEGSVARDTLERGQARIIPEKKAVKVVQPVDRPEFSNVTHYTDSRKIEAMPALNHPAITTQLPTALPAPNLPAKIDFSHLLQTFTPTQDAIMLGVDEQTGQPITEPMKRLFHIALCGSTGNGKDHLIRMLMPQFQVCGARVFLADPHYTDFDIERNEDWRPIRQRLAHAPITDYGEMWDMLDMLSREEIPKRLHLRATQKPTGAPVFLVLNETPAIIDELQKSRGLPVASALGKILREGRKVGILAITSTQDMLVKTLGFDSGGVRDCFRTAFYVGGDATSARVLLDLQKGQSIDENILGTGRAMLRTKALPVATAIRVPFVDNAALYHLLGNPGPLVASNAERSQGYTRPGAIAESGAGNARSISINGSTSNFDAARDAKPRQAELDRALAAYEAGSRSDRDLASALGQTPYRANLLKKILKEQYLID